MATIYDEYGNPVGDDGADDPFGGGFNQFMMPQMPGQNFSTAKWNFGSPQAIGQNTFNQSMTGAKGLMGMMGTPMFNYLTSVLTGGDTFDMDQLSGQSVGGGAYGGGGGSSYGAQQMPVQTPWLDSVAADPSDQVMTTIRDNVMMKGQNPSQIMTGLATTNITDPEQMKRYEMAANAMWGERNKVQQQAMTPGPQTAMQEWLAKTGLPDPREQYGGDNLPGDVDTSAADAGFGQRQNQFLEQAKQYQSQFDDYKAPTADPIKYASTPFSASPGQPGANDPIDAVDPMTRRIFGEEQRYINPAADKGANAWLHPGGVPGQADAAAAAHYVNPAVDKGAHEYEQGAGPSNPYVNPAVNKGNQPGGPMKQLFGAGVTHQPVGVMAPRWQQQANAPAQNSNSAWQRNEYARAAESARQKADENSGGGYRALIANQLQQQGRSPARDRIQSQLSMMRMLGISI